MGALEFTDHLIGHVLSWPVVVVVLCFLFRKPLAEVVREITSFKFGGAEIHRIRNYDRAGVQAATGAVQAVTGVTSDDGWLILDPRAEANPRWSALQQMRRMKGDGWSQTHVAEGRPNMAEINRLWWRVLYALESIIYAEGWDQLPRSEELLPHAAGVLLSQNKISPEIHGALMSLQEMFDIANQARPADIDAERAEFFRSIANLVLQSLRAGRAPAGPAEQAS